MRTTYQKAISALLIGLAILLPSAVQAQTYTLAPIPYSWVLTTTYLPVANGCVWTYQAGTTTAIATYSDSIGTPNGNPIIADNFGRFVAYLLPGTAYKFVYESTPCSAPSTHGTVLKTADNISGVPSSSATVDVVGTAGEAISLGQCAYLSDGSAGKNAGQWYKCDSANTYSSTTPQVGFAIAAIGAATQGTLRIAGYVTGLSSLSPGSRYYVGTSGAITATAPANQRFVGQADTATTLVATGDPPPTSLTAILNTPGIPCGRLTLTSTVPVTTADVTAATTLIYTPYTCATIGLFDGAITWNLRTLTEITIAVPGTTSQMYDVFVFDNSGTPALEVLAWTNDTTRATGLVLQNGVLVKSGATTRRYVGSFRTTAVSGQTEDSVLNRFVWNYYNRVDRQLKRTETANSWTYASATLHQANANTANAVNVVIGVSEEPLDVSVLSTFSNVTATNAPVVAIGLDSTTAVAGDQLVPATFSTGNNGGITSSRYYGLPTIGKHTLNWIEGVVNSGTAVTFYSNATTTVGGATTAAGVQSGIIGRIKG